MNSTDEMKKVRNHLRRQMKLIKNDPFLTDVANRISVRIVKWDKREHEVLICVRDLDASQTSWNSAGCRWIWVHTWSKFYLVEVWKGINSLINAMRYPDSIPF